MDNTQPSTVLDMKPMTVTASSSLVKAGPIGDQLVNSNHVTNIVHANTGPMISIKVNIIDLKSSKTLQFFPSTIIFDALKMIRDKVPDINSIDLENYGIFIPNSDLSKGTWLENNRSFEYYMLKSGDQIDFANKFRKLNLRLLDGETKSLLVDDSQVVGQLMISICSQIGISNYEEYSLINDIPPIEKEKTLTLRRQNDKSLNRDYKKMEELKKKLHTEDDIAWLDHSKTLRQQNIENESILILKRKFFFSDKNIDTRDPIQLNLLYVQCRDAILNGTHPINEEEAIKFAAIQCKVKNLDNNEILNKSGCLDLKEYLPKEYVKVKGIEKKILQENKSKLISLSELEAKLKYTQLCRSLKTYGVTFFLVKEKMKGKNKLVARLLGITKESILRVDEKTKEFLNIYPLECVKKWAASPNTFTLDFGDHYKEPYYSMQTTEGEHIARLISGYIDIILKKKKAKEFQGVEIDEESEMVEELISPSKATLIQMNKKNMNQSVSGNVVLPGILRNGQIEGNNQDCSFSAGTFKQNSVLSRQAHLGHTGTLVNPSNVDIENFAEHHRPLITTIRVARNAIQKSQSNLDEKPIIDDIGNDPASIQWKINMIDVNRQNVTSHLSAMNAATAQVVTLTSNGSQNTDYNAVGAAVSCISTNLADFSKDIAMISTLKASDDSEASLAQSPRLMDAAKKLCYAFTDFLRYVEPQCNEPRQNLFSAVSKIGEAGNDVIKNLNQDENELSSIQQPRLQDTFIGLAKTVASSTAGLVIASKNVANHCGHQQGVNDVISMVTQCALSTSQLVSCTKVCASTISSRECQEQVIEAARQVSRQVDAVFEIASHHCQNEVALAELNSNARSVSESVIQLLNSVKSSNEEMINMSQHSQQLYVQDESIEKIFNATDYLFNCMGDDTSEMIRQAKVLAQATTQLVNSLKMEANTQQTSDQQRKLLLAAKLLAEATSKMVEAAKSCATHPNDPDSQSALKKAAEDLKNATKIATGDNVQIRLLKRLELCAKQAASCATQSIAAIQVCTLYNCNSNPNSPVNNENVNNKINKGETANQSHSQLIQQCKQVADNVPKIVQGIRGCMVTPFAKSAHISLVNSCECFLLPAQKMILATKALLPTIVDEIKAIQLRNCTNQLANANYELTTCLSQMNEVCGSFEAEAMIDSIQLLDKELLELKNALLNGSNMKPLPGESLELCEAQLSASSKTVGLAMAQMLTAAVQGNESYTGVASKDTANSLKRFTHSIRAIVACSSNNPEYQEKLIHSARVVLQQSCNLVNESKQALLRPNESSQNQQRLAQIARLIAQSLYDCVNCLPGQNEIDQVIKRIADVSTVLFNEKDVFQHRQQQQFSTSENHKKLQSDLNQSALILNKTTNQIVIECHCINPDQLSQSSFQFSDDYANFLQNAFIIARTNSSQTEQQSVINSLRDVYANSYKLLHLSKSVISESTATSSRQQLTTAMKQVTESINSVINLCIAESSSDPIQISQKECDNALRSIASTQTIIHVDKQDGFLVINEPLLNDNNTSNTFNSYYDCLEQIIEKSKLLGESMTGIANSCKNPSNPSNFTHFINITSSSICGLVEIAAHSAYLIAISDVESKRGTPQILDTTNFINCSQNIQQTCQTLESLISSLNNDTGQTEKKQHLIQAATQIAHSTASLCAVSQQASARTTNILAKRHFVQSAKQVANATANFVKSIKSVDLTVFNASDKSQFHNLVSPLLEAVESLCQYALSPEFSSVPAIISENGAKSQIPILSATKTMLDASQQLIQASKLLIANNKDPHLWQSFSTNSKIISDSIKKLATAIKEKAPAKSECDQALSIIDKCMKHLESAILAIRMNQVLPLSELANSKSLQAYQEHAITCATQMIELIDQLRGSAKGEPEKLGHVVTELGQYFEPLVVNVIGCAAKTPFNNQLQTTYLEQTKTILESITQFMLASKEGASNPKSMLSLHQAIDENANGTREVLEDLVKSLEETSAQNGYVATMVDSLTKTIARIDLKYNNNLENEQDTPSFIDLQTRIVQLTMAIQHTVKDMSICDVSELGNYAQQLTQLFNSLIVASRGSIERCGSPVLASKIKITTQDLGKVSIDLINLAGQLQNNSGDKTLRNDLNEQIEMVNHRLLKLLESFQKSLKGTQACISADNSVQGIIADLNTVIMFATAGTLRSDTDSDSFSNHREAVLRTAKNLVEDTKALVSTTGNVGPFDQNALAIGVNTSVKTITKLSDAVKLGAASLGSEQPDAQVLLINAVKDVASSLTDLIGAIKITSNSTNEINTNENINDLNGDNNLRESAKNMVTNVQSLLKTVKTVEDEAARGTRALESAIEAIYQEVKLYSNYINSENQSFSFGDNSEQKIIENITTKPDDLIKATKQITLATSKAIGAGNSLRQDDVITAANIGRKAVSDLLYVCRGNFANDPTSTNKDHENDYQRQVLSIGLNCSLLYKELLEFIQQIFQENINSETKKQDLVVMSKNISSSVSNILQIAEILKGTDWCDPENQTFIAENELLGAANSIETAAKKLSVLQPRKKITQNANENLNFDEQILEAAKSITNAAGVLIKAATVAQTELISQGKIRPVESNEEDGQWSQGLISAARLVAVACHTLCEAANGLVQGHATEDRLISSAKQVASSTAALLVACKVKAELTSQAMRRLQHAGNAIKRASDALVRSAQQAVKVNEEDQYLELNTKFVGSIAQEIMLREEILRKERELKEAQAAYNAVKKARYHREETSPNSVSSSGTNSSSQNSSSSPSTMNEKKINE